MLYFYHLFFKLVVFLGLDNFVSTYFRKSKLLLKLIPKRGFYDWPTRKKVNICGVHFELMPKDNGQYRLFKPHYKHPDNYGINHILSTIKNEKNIVVLDIGANVGQHSLQLGNQILKRLPSVNLTILAFEPNPKARQFFSKNLSLNPQLKNKIEIIPVGLGSTKENLELQAPKRDTACGSLVRNYQHEPHESEFVTVTTLDNYLMKKVSVEKVDFIKIDVENFEYEVLKGALKTLRKFKPKMYIEMGQKPAEQGKIYQFLFDLDYQVAAENGDELIPVIKDNYESFIKPKSLYNIWVV